MKFDLDGKTVLLTGGTGTWGREFVRQLLECCDVRQIRIYSRGEYRQVEMRRMFQACPKLRYIIGDVRDLQRLQRATRDVDVIIHLAAIKHVPVVEENTREALETNTIGTRNVIDAAESNRVSLVFFVSSDKAVDPLNFYGITKLAAERLMIAANEECNGTRFIVYRAGNVMGSAGSAIPVFQKELLLENVIRITDPGMTRFFLSCPDAVSKALDCLRNGLGGEIFVPKMKATTLELLLRVMISNLGNKETLVHRIAVRPGEKLSESVVSRHESARTRELERVWVILPFFLSERMRACYEAAPLADFEEYTSDAAEAFTFEELEDLLRLEGFLSRADVRDEPRLHWNKNGWVFT